MWHLCNHSVAESHGFYTILSFLPSLAAYTTPPNTPHASLQFNERREYKERDGEIRVDEEGTLGQDTNAMSAA